MKSSEIIGIVTLVLLLFGTIFFFGYVNSINNANDINSIADKTGEYLKGYAIGEVIGTIFLVIVGFIVAILIFLGVVKKG